jgi:DNA topoisomerase IA
LKSVLETVQFLTRKFSTPLEEVEHSSQLAEQVQGYKAIDPELVLPTVRSYVERQLDLIAHGSATMATVVSAVLKQFKAKYQPPTIIYDVYWADVRFLNHDGIRI